MSGFELDLLRQHPDEGPVLMVNLLKFRAPPQRARKACHLGLVDDRVVTATAKLISTKTKLV